MKTSPLFLVLLLIIATSCSHSNSNSGDGLAGPGTVVANAKNVCRSAFLAPTQGVQISPDQMLGQRNILKKISSAQFALTPSSDDSGKFAFLGYIVDVNDQGPKFTKVCGGSSETSSTFTFKGPAVIRGKDSTIQSVLSGEINGDPGKDVQADVKITTGTAGKLDLTKPPTGGEVQIFQLNPTTVQVWMRVPADTGKGEFLIRDTYHIEDIEPLDLFKESYDWAYSGGGPNLDSHTAQTFAAKVSALGVSMGGAFLDAYKDAYDFMYNKVNDSRDVSLKYADALASTPQPLKTISTFKKAYSYAYDGNGLNKTRDEALKFAAAQVGINP